MSQDIKIRSYQTGDENEIVPLLQFIFDGWPHFDLHCDPIDFWKWKYLDNPIAKGPITLAIRDEKIVGCYHTIPQKLKVKNKKILWADGVDAAVHPNSRKMGIYNKTLKTTLYNLMNNGIAIWKGVTGNPILIKTLAKRYPYFPKPVITQVRIKNIELHLENQPVTNQLIKKTGFKVLNKLNKIWMSSSTREVRRDKFEIEPISSFSNQIEAFWEQISKHYDCIVERKVDYLNWRYCDPRCGNFIVKQAVEEDIIQGFIVYRINRYNVNYPVGTIVDLMTLPTGIDVAKALVSDAVNYFDKYEVNVCKNLVIKNHPYERVLNGFGFIDSKAKFHLFYKPLIEENELDDLRLSQSSRIHVSYGDTDWI